MDVTVSFGVFFLLNLPFLLFVYTIYLFIYLIVSKSCVLFGRQGVAERERERDNKPEIPEEGIQNGFECSFSETRV